MYGPLDMITLTGEKVDIHIMRDAPAGEWIQLSTEVTDKTGRITYTIRDGKSLSYGLYPVKVKSSVVIFVIISQQNNI
jgi:membrane-associated phosphatidylinositol transfer protein